MVSVYLAHYLALPPQFFGFVGVRRHQVFDCDAMAGGGR
jgi:hypothetical protein